jgi:molecular chaperone DnaJ
MSKKGNASLNGDSGDLLIKINVKPHPKFKRNGADILSERKITVTEAILGASLEVETVYGKQKLKISPGTNNGEDVVITGMGVNKLPPNQS